MKNVVDIGQDNRQLGDAGRRAAIAGLVLGVLGLTASVVLAYAFEGGMKRALFSYLVNFAYFLSLALGGLCFVLIQHATRAGWSVSVRRVAEAVAAAMPVMVVLFVPLVFGLGQIYHWAHPDAVAHDHLLQHKAPYLNTTFFSIRWALYFAVWIGAGWFLYRRSVAQDSSGDPAISLKMQRFSAAMILPFALTLTFASFDILMSLDAHWFSSIFGVYYFAGSFLGFNALLALIIRAIQRAGRLGLSVTVEHFHDLGKLTFAFVVFWAYIAFSQFMLIWYANIPEETSWFYRRQAGGWTYVSILLIVGHFFVPFLGLISREAKRNLKVLAAFAVWILLMHWVDLYWIVMPELDPGSSVVPFHLVDLTTFVGVGGLFAWAVASRLGAASLVPERDPRLVEAMTFENV